MCIRQTCTAGQPFSPVALLTLFEENCKNPLPPTILSNASALAVQDSVSSQSPAPSTTADSVNETPAVKAAAASTIPLAHPSAITTTFLGIATDANGQQETFTVPALVGITGTIWGKPVTGEPGAASPTSTVTLPWPTLPVGYFSMTHSSGTLSPSASGQQNSMGGNQKPAIQSSPTAVEGSTGTRGQKGSATGVGNDGGTVLEASEGTIHRAESSLGLMVVLMVGVMWF
ncbi:MAG: hypothetical protein Q9170_006351 [Blastenia crenularia]